MGKELKDLLRPRKDEDSVRLPVTFVYSGGRDESSTTRKYTAWILGVLNIIIGIFLLFGKNNSGIFAKLVIVSLFYYFSFLFIRYVVLREHKLRKEYYSQIDTDHELSLQDIWGIYEIDGEGLKVCHFRNGKKAIFVKLEKDVIVGRDSDSEFMHYEAIADAYNKAYEVKAVPIHINLMSYVGKDERIDGLYANAGKCSNPDVRVALNSVYSNLESQLLDETSTFDIYCFIYSSSETDYVYKTREILTELLKANYMGYIPLGDLELRDLVVDLFNLNKFSVVSAMQDALADSEYSIVVPIELRSPSGVSKLNKTKAEIRKAQQDKAKLDALVEKEKRRRKEENKKSSGWFGKKSKPKKVEDDIIEL